MALQILLIHGDLGSLGISITVLEKRCPSKKVFL
jgi:hypothetical protein